MHTVIPALRTDGGDGPVILGADLNLGFAQAPNARSCLASGFQEAGDGGTQDVVVSGELTLTFGTAINMHGTTDHPALLADVTTTALDPEER